MIDAWKGFEGGLWQSEINVRDFIQRNYTAYDGDKSFLAGPTDATQHNSKTLIAIHPIIQNPEALSRNQ